jgi:pimeloyl-ACP methyl ester carboxylesterase
VETIMPASLRQFRITASPGLALSVAEHGAPNGSPMLLLHGYTDSWRSYEPLLAALPPSFRAIALSQRGHGDSAKPSTGYRVGEFAADLRGAMDHLGLADAVIVAHSMGSLVATRFAIDHSARVRALVLIGAFATLKGNAAAEAFWNDGVAAMADPIDAALVRGFQESTLARPVPSAFLDTVIAESRKVPAFVWRRAFRAMLDDDFTGEIGSIAAPTLLVWGDRDGFSTAAEQERLLSAIPLATLSVHEGAGHAPHWEDPGRVAAEITVFLERTVRLAA